MKIRSRHTQIYSDDYMVERPIERQNRSVRSLVKDYAPFVCGGLALVVLFAAAGNYLGQKAAAKGQDPLADQLAGFIAKDQDLIAKGALMPDVSGADIAYFDGKSDILGELDVGDGKEDVINPLAVINPATLIQMADGKQDRLSSDIEPKVAPKLAQLVVTPASVNLKEETKVAVIKPPTRKLSLLSAPAPTEKRANAIGTIDSGVVDKLAKPEKSARQLAAAQKRVQLAEENCLARAVYFEARSESEMGQLAVAKVILNRTRDPNYPKTICGVVYQGSGTRNSCQFSFACDGMADDVRQPGAWSRSKMIAQKAIAGQGGMSVMSTATNYHADYVTPSWAKSMKRLVKIGRHIFYSDS